MGHRREVATLSRASAPVAPLPLVGRTAELAMLRRVLEEATSSRGRTVVLHGEPGIGKTRLVQETVELAGARGWTTAIGRAYPVETGMPYAPFADALVPLLQRYDRAALATLTRGGGELAQLFPVLASHEDAPRGLRDTLGASPAELKARLLWNFTQFLTRLAAKHPVLLVLENLQWADASSIELLHFTARQIGTAPIVLLCTYSDAERDHSTALRQAEQSLLSLGAAASHQLEPLPRAAVDELLSQMFKAGESTREFAALLYGWTRGNPFFVEETLKALVESGRLWQRDGRWMGWEMAEMGLPRSVRDAVTARVQQLGPSARALAEVTAVLGTRATFGQLRAVSAQGPEELVAAVDELCAQRILVVDSDQTTYDFAHPIVRDTIYREIGGARTRMLHGLVAESLERYHGPRGPEHASELAFHFRRAGAGDGADSGLAAKAIRYLSAAGRAALASYANREAADALAEALALLAREPQADELEPDVTLVEDLAKARQRLGEYDAAEKLWYRVLRHAERANRADRVAVIERRLGLAAYWSGRLQEALTHYQVGLEAARASRSDSQEARLLLARATCLQELGMPAEAQNEAELALSIAETLRDPALLARVHRTLLLRYMWAGSTSLAREHGARVIALADEAQEPVLAWSGHWALAMMAGLTGDGREMDINLGKALRLADELRSPVFRLWTAELVVHYKTAVGEWDSALEIAERTIAEGRVLGQRTLTPRMLVWAGLIYLARDEFEQGRRYMDEAWELSSAERVGPPGAHDRRVDVHSVVVAHIGRAYSHMFQYEFTDAIRIAGRGLAIADRSGYVVWAIYRLLPVLAECYFRAGQIELGEAIAKRLRSESERVGHKLGLAWASAADSIGPMLREEWDQAFGLMRQAIEKMDEIPFVLDSARLRHELARRLARVGDREAAAREYRLAHEVFVRLGTEGNVERAREEMRRLGMRPPSRILPGSGVAGLTQRESDIARLVAGRKSNKEIGKALGISSRTVSTHLSNIFEKVGVSSRVELADAVRSIE